MTVRVTSSASYSTPVNATLTIGGVSDTFTVTTNTAPGNLSVTPIVDINSSGPQGGPFTPSRQVFTVQNKGGSSADWSASIKEAWVKLSATSGNLEADSTTTIVLFFSTNANSLSEGDYNDTLIFRDTAKGTVIATITIKLKVKKRNATILWDQPASNRFIVNQNFLAPKDKYDTFVTDDFTNTSPWSISTIFIPGGTWDLGDDLSCANSLNLDIYSDNDGKPSGSPGSGATFRTRSFSPSDQQVLLSAGRSGDLTDVTLNLNQPIILPEGTWWLSFYPEMDFTACGQYGRHFSNTTNGAIAMAMNPGGGFDWPTYWSSIQLLDSVTEHDISFRLETKNPDFSLEYQGTIGTQITLDDYGFGVKKGKVLVGNAATKILNWTDTSVTFEITKTLPPETYDIVIKPSGTTGGDSIIYPGALTIIAPEIVSVTPPSGSAGTPVEISGNFFGSKKGKVYLENASTGKKKRCKVTSWGMDSITFMGPKTSKSFPAKEYLLRVTNKVGEDDTTFAVE